MPYFFFARTFFSMLLVFSLLFGCYSRALGWNITSLWLFRMHFGPSVQNSLATLSVFMHPFCSLMEYVRIICTSRASYELTFNVIVDESKSSSFSWCIDLWLNVCVCMCVRCAWTGQLKIFLFLEKTEKTSFFYISKTFTVYSIHTHTNSYQKPSSNITKS